MSARLSGLTIGELTLTPAFSSDVTEYTATTANATDKITATPEDEAATVEIGSQQATIAADGTATWALGENEVEITVENGDASKVYAVTVTKTTDDAPLLDTLALTRDTEQTLELSPEFSPSVFSYTATADANDWELALQLTSNDAQASVKVGDGEAVTYTAPMAIELVPTGTTAIQITVSAPYHTTDAVYTIAVTVE